MARVHGNRSKHQRSQCLILLLCTKRSRHGRAFFTVGEAGPVDVTVLQNCVLKARVQGLEPIVHTTTQASNTRLEQNQLQGEVTLLLGIDILVSVLSVSTAYLVSGRQFYRTSRR